MLSPPAKAINPDKGTRTDANGTPWAVAYPIVPFEKWPRLAIKKINE
jgi:hypothetical protein